eukprot:CAMPEP_0184008942 /NCGR_PEP_ID=MMETSP0954-20121128/2293_1 /TAXON_ID=627963 /ORGANISM="Aplanochytrium sp, Strain PBS07" /LENGTH=140 /DNA_ID=CAMNT_0026288187 /DNA_START=601 /DNA_END=1023 /DNA_ORIENTATION=+
MAIDCALTYPKALGGAISVSGEIFPGVCDDEALSCRSENSKHTPILCTFGNCQLTVKEEIIFNRAKNNFIKHCTDNSGLSGNTVRRFESIGKRLIEPIAGGLEIGKIMELVGERMYSSSTETLQAMADNGELILLNSNHA